MLIPNKLILGDEIRVIAPSRSASLIGLEAMKDSEDVLVKMGYKISYGKHIYVSNEIGSSSIEQRIKDLHDAFNDPNVKAIFTVIGGHNSNELLPYIDYDLIKRNPKILCGYSDITALSHAITAKTGLMTYSGPHFSSFRMQIAQAYQTDYFLKCLTQETAYDIKPADVYSDDLWFLDQVNRNMIKNAGYQVYQHGQAKGHIIGGNLCTLNLLQGTPYFLNFDRPILMIEDDYLTNQLEFSRNLHSLLQAVGSIGGLLIGRFQNESNMTNDKINFVLNQFTELKNIPIIYNLDFGHTQPILTFPIGGMIEIDTMQHKICIKTH